MVWLHPSGILARALVLLACPSLAGFPWNTMKQNNDPPNLFLTDLYFISTKVAIPIFYFNNMPKRSATINRKRFCPNSENQICKMPPMILNLWAVFRWMEQYLNQQLPTGFAYTGPPDCWRMTITAEDNYTTWLLRFTNIDPTNQKSVPYFAINLLLAQRMGWI